MIDCQKTKTYLEKVTHQITSKKFCSKIIFEIKAVKDTETSTYVVQNIYRETFTGVKKKAKIALKVKKVWKKKVRSSVELKEYNNSYSSQIEDVVCDK